MDIRLIFRNRRRTAHDEPFDAKRLKLDDVFGQIRAERANRSGSSQAMERRRKVASAWRWLSTSKGAGRGVGKSAPHEASGLIVTAYAGSRVILCCREKLLARFEPPVPQTDSGDQVENTKASE